MSKSLPVGNFQWLDGDEIYTYTEQPEYIRWCTLEVNLEYPEELHDLHSDYPLAPKTVTVNDTKKLFLHLGNRKRYVLHHETLRQCLKYGMKLTKIQRGIRYTESKFLEKYIVSNTESRIIAKNEFEKELFKLMNNSVFGKTMENVRERSKIKIVNGQDTEKLERLIARPNYRGSFVFENSELVSMSMGESKVTLNKPIYLGQAILDLSKTLMYDFHYRYVKTKYGDRARLLFTDTDSLCYRIHTEDFYEVALSVNDERRYVIPNDLEHRTLALGHYGINRLQGQQAWPEDDPIQRGHQRPEEVFGGLASVQGCGRYGRKFPDSVRQTKRKRYDQVSTPPLPAEEVQVTSEST